ncbi:MAG: hypothetical protein NWQ46_04870 [Spirosomaceae bacterium]|nr:hypothetical protein [Spirosomataceae bacterium]
MGKFKITLIIILVLTLLAGYYVSTGYYSKGERAGTISKMSEKGYVFKTYEGVLNEGGYSGETGTLTPRYWDFSAKEDSVVNKLRDAMQTGERVTLTYHEKFFQFSWNGDTKYFIVDVVFLPKPKQPVYEMLPQPQAAPPVEIDTVAKSTQPEVI